MRLFDMMSNRRNRVMGGTQLGCLLLCALAALTCNPAGCLMLVPHTAASVLIKHLMQGGQIGSLQQKSDAAGYEFSSLQSHHQKLSNFWAAAQASHTAAAASSDCC
eukprot:TRINITY_DN5614_c0_g2_i1.p1 TRINITY_DN5614_c0_g2~~TRINITY_DN5614_c0_g2_i1.p1  ORF type:complete len:106 (-),score=0.66 TRINITY_DN5614_c0_g2_i1:154-471(-)